MCRVCHRCRKFVIVEDDTYEGMRRVQKFELNHSGHPVGTADITELGEYTDVSGKY